MIKDIFFNIYKDNFWGSNESVSGRGSELINTQSLRESLPVIFKKYNIKSVLDIPCGDFNWMKTVDLSNISYIGADVVPDIIEKNKLNHPNIDFRVINLINDELVTSDLIIVRDCLIHLSNRNIIKALSNIKKSNSKYMLVTTSTKNIHNEDVVDGGFRKTNMMIHPFNLNPIEIIKEEGDDKHLILIEINQIFNDSSKNISNSQRL